MALFPPTSGLRVGGRLNYGVRPYKEVLVKLVGFLLVIFAISYAQASDLEVPDRTRDMKVCEESATLITTAYTLHPVDAQARVNFINSEKDKIARDSPALTIEDRHLLPAMAAITFHLVELGLISSDEPLSVETQIRLASRSGAACGLLSGLPHTR